MEASPFEYLVMNQFVRRDTQVLDAIACDCVQR
jgi:hypothetical protein